MSSEYREAARCLLSLNAVSGAFSLQPLKSTRPSFCHPAKEPRIVLSVY